MKTLLFTIEYPPFKGGVANYYGQLEKFWPEVEDFYVLENSDNQLIKKWLPICKWLPAIFALHAIIKKRQIKHVLVGQVLPLGTVVWLLSFFLDFKYSVFLHGMDIEFAVKEKRKKRLFSAILKRSQNIICNSSYTASLVKKHLEEVAKKIQIVNPGIDPDFLSKIGEIEDVRKRYKLEDRIILFSLGRLVKRKGFDKVISVMSEVNKYYPELVYVIAGAGPDEEYLKDLRSELDENIKNNIVFLGQVSEQEKWSWLKASDIFVTVSRDIDGDVEGFGIVYLEANLAGKPVIAGESGGVKDAVIDGVNGLLVDPQNNYEISGAIIKLAGNKNLRNYLGGQGRERALKEFKWEEQVRKIYNITNLNSKHQ